MQIGIKFVHAFAIFQIFRRTMGRSTGTKKWKAIRKSLSTVASTSTMPKAKNRTPSGKSLKSKVIRALHRVPYFQHGASPRLGRRKTPKKGGSGKKKTPLKVIFSIIDTFQIRSKWIFQISLTMKHVFICICAGLEELLLLDLNSNN